MDKIINKEQITISFTQDLYDEWTQMYFKKHPRATKKPLLSSNVLLSMNRWIILPRMSAMTLKERWKEFVTWVVEKHGYTNLNIKRCEVDVKILYPTRKEFDLDNFSSNKYVFDGFSNANLWIDDSYTHVQKISISGEYKPKVAQLDYIITILEK